ncbi:MAG: AAA family ATPase [Defluviitaleaceae bacterium]|nr:AAA family ATPase [Defluviitaleaceae bacterium]MCL2263728.1 AAA family ATPase [Defluviitaleaceae bacterium]
MPRELDWKDLKYFSKPQKFTAKEAKAAKKPLELIGQPRAAEALKFGLEMKAQGYHVYICGAAGTGRTTFAQEYANAKAAKEEIPPDLCYVYNFENPKCPKLLTIPAGTGKQLKDDMNELVTRLSEELPRTFADKSYEQKKNDIVKVLKNRQDEVIKEMSIEARKQDFEVKNSNTGIFFVPIVEGEAITEEQFELLSSEQKEQITKKSESIQARAADALREIKDYEKTTKKEVDELDFAIGLFTVGHHMNDLFETFGDEPALLEYLKAVKEDILENLADFVVEENEEDEAIQTIMPWVGKKSTDDNLTKYKINLITDNSELTGAPVVVDYNPSYTNLVGEVEYDNEYGNFSTDFMKIKPGLLHKANGGYLILQAQDILGSPHAWETLRRTLITEKIITEPLREYTTGVAVSGIKPEAIPLSIKIIIIGGSYYYDLLYSYDDYFEKLFKIRVDFDYEMKLNDENLSQIVKFITRHAENDKTALPYSSDAIARIIEHATRLAERKDRLTTRFNRLTEIMEESAAWAKVAGAKKVTATHVKTAIEKREYRLNMYEEKLSEMIEEDCIMVSTSGEKVGQINGLAVLDTGDHVFAKPSRITATAYMGKAGIVNIEKEAEMSGPIHEKGVQVLIGYLGQTYAKDFPLSLSCRICFEQNYNGVDGDSASSTELYAILSALAEIPIRQDIAITGSINQHGEIQPIGGATYKIEGFFDLCKKRGLTGDQGVIIPTRNVRDLVLKDEVIDAVKAGKFHIYPIEHVNEGFEILMRLPAGQFPYPADTVHGKVFRKLRSYHRKGMKE